MNSKVDNNEDEMYEEYKGLSSKHLVFAIAFIGILSFVVIIGLQQNPGQSVTAARQDGDNLVVKVAEVKPVAKFYYYSVNDIKIQFFVVLGFDNQPHIAFDACDVCYASKKGYAHKDPYMECRNCGNTFLVDAIGTENLAGGCWPSYLPITVSSGNILIKISDVTQKQYMFA
jgi:uncharacterized membrane protein